MALFHGIHMESFHGIHGIIPWNPWNHSMESMESMWNHSMEYMLEWAKQVWIPSSFHMEQSGIPYGIDHSMAIPYGIQGDHGTRK